MYTERTVYDAIKGSIKKWQDISVGELEDEGPLNCPLCHLFYTRDENTCLGCPIYQYTKQIECIRTPYGLWKDLTKPGVRKARTPKQKESAYAEVDFLYKIETFYINKLHEEAIEENNKLFEEEYNKHLKREEDKVTSDKEMLEAMKTIYNRFTGAVILKIDDLQGANLRGADLRGADLRRADLRVADLRGANIQGADLRGADLRGAYLRVADLWRADLQEADLRGADLQETNLQEANLHEADLWGANIQEANLQEANLCGADLQEANLWRANLRRADLRGANLDFSCFPLWCGSFNIKVDDRFYWQLIAHIKRLDVSKCSKEVKENHKSIQDYNKFCKYRTDVKEI